jgi:putative hemolysin
MARRALIETQDILKAAKMNSFFGETAAKILMTLLQLDKLNKIYSEIGQVEGMEFLDAIISRFGIRFELNEEEINRIPSAGPFITISNHPFGGIDGLILLKIICQRRPDFKMMGNFLLQRIEPIKSYIIPVNPFEDYKQASSSYKGLKSGMNHLNTMHPIGIFPAGEVSSFNPNVEGISDRQWQTSVIKFIKNAEIPVVPVYFQGTNSWLFHALGRIHPVLRTIKLPSELMNKNKKIIHVRIGKPISLKDQQEFTEPARYGRFLRAKTYALGSSLEVKKFFIPAAPRVKREEIIIDPVPLDKLESELRAIREDFLLFNASGFHVYCAPPVRIPGILAELGRLREITFREIGEGTNKKIDVDEFDIHYYQLFVWDSSEKKIVGGYRVGKGADILREYGSGGFYIRSLFKIDKEFNTVLKESIELGRSFIIKEYQRKPMPLFFLWKGILYFLVKNPKYRYLIGPVSISNRFSNFSKNVMVGFIRKNYYNQGFARYVKPRNKFKLAPITNVDMEILYEITRNINKLDQLISDIETNYRMPVLLKKYLQLNGKIIGFNIDPKFNECLDGLIILDVFDVPIETISSLSKEIKDESIMERFYVSQG